MQSFDLDSLLQQTSAQDKRYLEFLRPSMSLGIYQLSAGETDLQKPHKQDEVYYVLSGKAKLRVGVEVKPALPGAIFFVEAGAEHKFIAIEDDLTLLVFFAPAEEN